MSTLVFLSNFHAFLPKARSKRTFLAEKLTFRWSPRRLAFRRLFLDITGLLAFLLLRRAVPHAQSQSVLAFVAIKPVCSFDACSAQHNYGRDLALHFFERVGFSTNPPRQPSVDYPI